MKGPLSMLFKRSQLSWKQSPSDSSRSAVGGGCFRLRCSVKVFQDDWWTDYIVIIAQLCVHYWSDDLWDKSQLTWWSVICLIDLLCTQRRYISQMDQAGDFTEWQVIDSNSTCNPDCQSLALSNRGWFGKYEQQAIVYSRDVRRTVFWNPIHTTPEGILINPIHSCRQFDQSCPIPKEFWILPAPAESWTNSTQFRRNSD